MNMFPNMEKDTGEIMFIRGVKAGLELFSWWKDGTQYVGSCGTTLKQALEDLDKGKYNDMLKPFYKGHG